VFPDDFGCNGWNRRGGHVGKYYCRILTGFLHAEPWSGTPRMC
jgi:hypothetical protein